MFVCIRLSKTNQFANHKRLSAASRRVSYLQLKGSFYPIISHWSPVFFFSDAQNVARYQTPKLGHAL
ncbi:predicted protein [Botrytis cinerea T4]|uniref:Uncharacterized protein n=1 Tax=Botryotinia fuckeliana (strain T4) TaxID=999810 RepID=G2YHZ0_BOTF4|nr:predicted protein [Botrytis cinerea T4]